MQLLSKLNYIFSKKQKLELLWVFILITVGAFLELAGVSVILPFVNAIISPESVLSSKGMNMVYSLLGFKDANGFIIFLALFIIFVYVLKNLFLSYMYNVQYRFNYDNQRELSTMMMRRYISQPYSYHLVNGSEKMIQHITKDIDMFMAAVSGAMFLATELFVCIAIITYLFIKDKSITLGLLIVMLAFVGLYFIFIKGRVKTYGIEVRKDNEKINKTIIESFGGIKEIKILERENYFIEKYDDSYAHFAEAQRKYQLLSVVPRPIMEAVCISGMLSVVALKMARGVSMAYFIPTLSLFVVAAFRMLPSFSRISSYMSQVIFNKAAVDYVYNDLKTISALSISNSEDNKIDDIIFNDKITVENVSFSYARNLKDVLESVNMEIHKNESVGLIGPSGQGKTTLADLLLGLLMPTAGSIKVDGNSISEKMILWHSKVGYIPQTIFLCDDTIKNNIAFGVKEEDINDELIWEALEEAQLLDFISELEDGINTCVGERGVRLSGGQRQRIGIARALYNKPDILVLDEATSALDNDTEIAVMDAINSLLGNKTLIIIAHRLSTIKKCDSIYQVNEGKITRVYDINQ